MRKLEKMAALKAAKKVRLQGASPPVFQSLEDFSQGSKQNKQRYDRLVATFEERHGRKPDFLARAPGRVNIIGEHIDYSGYAVLPMAIEQDVALACSRNDAHVLRLSNYCESYPEHSRSTRETAVIDGHEWFDYFLCGYKGVVDDLGVQGAVGMNVVVDGNVPPSAGLSSSSALVCCAALATAYANRVVMPSKQEFAELCAKCERYIGTEGGGMDQAISFLGERSKAMLIEFNPICPTIVRLPNDAIFVISNTRVQANKVAFASYNERVVECRLASVIMAKAKGLPDWKNMRKLSQLQAVLSLQLSEMHEVVSLCLHKEVYSRDEVCSLLNLSEKELESEYLNNMTKDMMRFELYKRASHVFKEAERVYEFKDTANTFNDTANTQDTANTSDAIGNSANTQDTTDKSDAVSDTANTQDTANTPDAISDTANTPDTANITATKLGQLMDDSHASCSQLYECSCPELDTLVSVCKSSGALGSRLTGAGWGGCAVSLVRAADLESFLKGVSKGYYEGEDSDKLSSCLFATSPGPGAAICDLSH